MIDDYDEEDNDYNNNTSNTIQPQYFGLKV
jgi:hypothetical protein